MSGAVVWRAVCVRGVDVRVGLRCVPRLRGIDFLHVPLRAEDDETEGETISESAVPRLLQHPRGQEVLLQHVRHVGQAPRVGTRAFALPCAVEMF